MALGEPDVTLPTGVYLAHFLSGQYQRTCAMVKGLVCLLGVGRFGGHRAFRERPLRLGFLGKGTMMSHRRFVATRFNST